MGSIQDQQLMLEENGFRNHGTDAARAKEPANCSEGMNEKHEEMAHRSIVARTANAKNCRTNFEFAMHRPYNAKKSLTVHDAVQFTGKVRTS